MKFSRQLTVPARFERLAQIAEFVTQAARESGLHRKSIERLVKKYALDAKAMKPKT